MSNRPVTSISARKRGTTRFLTGSTPSTCSASSSSRILRAPRSAVIAVPATPESTIAVTNGANSRIEASTKKPPRRSSAPNSTRKCAACRPGAPYPKAPVETTSGNQHSFSAKRNCDTNSPPYGYGGRRADMIVFPVRIIMSPTSSSRLLAGRNARSATPRTINLPRLRRRSLRGRSCGHKTRAGEVIGVKYPNAGTFATDGIHSRSDEVTVGHARRHDRARRGLWQRAAPGRRRAVGLLQARGRGREVPGLAVDRAGLADDRDRPQRRHEGGAQRRRDGRDRPVEGGAGHGRVRPARGRLAPVGQRAPGVDRE